ncbi:MAG: phosphoribosylamine--glycine ligase [Campylobacteraceae bacterium]|jgi:phosphoribosylamine--glycine ligase|nr:phosphoribosylamine--glycine ligase [Campylobacteraceae bacterium]
MKILIVGSGGREYAIALALKRDENVKNLYFAPGNGATDELGVNIDIKDFEKLAEFAKKESIDLTIVGPETPLVEGIADVFKKHNLTIFGVSKDAAKLEGSKAFMKDFLFRHNIPTAKYIQTSSVKKANDFIDTLIAPIVVKADGLCAGKGVIIAKSKDEAKDAAKSMLNGESFGNAGKNVVIEEFLDGFELSIFAICDGENYKILPAAQDHKRLLDNDEGPNTGGMGAYAPTPLANDDIYTQVEEFVVKPTLKGMKEEGASYTGVLFIGAMIVDKKVYVLEYNVRFGDPECEVLMPLLKTSASELFYKAATGRLNELDLKFKDEFAVGVVVASKDYPYKNSEPKIIDIDDKKSECSHVAYAGVCKKEGSMYANGGRVLVCVGTGKSIKAARDNAYDLTKKIFFEGAKFRNDIAYQALK